MGRVRPPPGGGGDVIFRYDVVWAGISRYFRVRAPFIPSWFWGSVSPPSGKRSNGSFASVRKAVSRFLLFEFKENPGVKVMRFASEKKFLRRWAGQRPERKLAEHV